MRCRFLRTTLESLGGTGDQRYTPTQRDRTLCTGPLGSALERRTADRSPAFGFGTKPTAVDQWTSESLDQWSTGLTRPSVTGLPHHSHCRTATR